ncbi:MAG: hypothetical protein COU72_01585, partial [Parcubacteria group bacterium CG10_big_fil_rev_8_21_14_0_10_41_35]
VKALVDEVLSLGGNDESVRLILTDKKIRHQIAKLLVDTSKVFGQIYSVVVDYGMSLFNMISVGNYDYVNSNITAEHFPTTSEGVVKTKEVVLFHFNRDISSEVVIAEMNKAGYQPANIAELLALGAQKPELQLGFPIVGLGSVWRDPDGYRGSPVLRRDGSERKLCLFYFGLAWYAYYRFAAVRKS